MLNSNDDELGLVGVVCGVDYLVQNSGGTEELERSVHRNWVWFGWYAYRVVFVFILSGNYIGIGIDLKEFEL